MSWIMEKNDAWVYAGFEETYTRLGTWGWYFDSNIIMKSITLVLLDGSGLEAALETKMFFFNKRRRLIWIDLT